MRKVTVRLDEATRATLLASKIEGNKLTLPGQLEKSDYQRVAKAIEAAGGKWSRKDGCHVFPGDVRETMNLNGDSVEMVNQQQTFQSFYTPGGVASQMMVAADLTAGDRVLEPSAGDGRLIKAALFHGIFRGDVTAVEIDPRMKCHLIGCGEIHIGDFLAWNPPGLTFDRILMNPPFSRGDDIRHIRHAMSFLGSGGRLVAICGNGPKQREAFEPICDMWTDLEAGAFKESGTNVSVAMIVIEGGGK